MAAEVAGGAWPQPRDTWSPRQLEELERTLPLEAPEGV